DLAVKQTVDKTKLIQPGGSATLMVTLKAGKYELYCTVPGHEAAGMKLNITVTSSGQPAAAAPPQTSTKAATTTAAAKPQATTVAVDETEFKITTASTSFKAGQITFQAKNVGKIPHDLAVNQTLHNAQPIQPGGSAKLTVTLKPGTYELYCTVPGHEAAGMKQNITVASRGPQPAADQLSATTQGRQRGRMGGASEPVVEIGAAAATVTSGQVCFLAKHT